jgi:hypothetical protein
MVEACIYHIVSAKPDSGEAWGLKYLVFFQCRTCLDHLHEKFHQQHAALALEIPAINTVALTGEQINPGARGVTTDAIRWRGIVQNGPNRVTVQYFYSSEIRDQIWKQPFDSLMTRQSQDIVSCAPTGHLEPPQRCEIQHCENCLHYLVGKHIESAER